MFAFKLQLNNDVDLDIDFFQRSFIRNFLMFSLHLILRIVGVGSIRDTQCGFKLFTRPAAQSIFPAQHLTTWIFDVELLLLATQMGIPVEEVPIEWHEVEGSKLNVMIDSLGMLRDLLVLRGNMIFGRWGGKVGKGSTTATATGGGGGKKKRV